jgi:hypothetical protein
MPTLRPVLLAVLLWALSAPAAALAFDVEYSTAGAMDAPATQGGDVDGWGTDFLARWVNTTGRDVLLEEFGWPCGGWWAQSWFVWIQADLPPGPWGFQHYGSFVPTLEDDTLYPPNLYTYVDVADRGIVVPAGAAMLFGYSNPGMANGTTTAPTTAPPSCSSGARSRPRPPSAASRPQSRCWAPGPTRSTRARPSPSPCPGP